MTTTKHTHRWSRAWGAAAILSAITASSEAAHARPSDPPPAEPQPVEPQSGPITPEASQKADDLFKKGKDLYKEGKLREAYDAYRGAWDLKKSYDLAANLGNAELQLGLKRDAADHYAYCLKTFAVTGGKERREAAQKKFDEARKEVGALVIKVSVGGAEVLVDGRSVGRAPLRDEVYVDPGARVVEARLTGFETAKQGVQVEKGSPTETVTLTLTPTKVEGPPPGPGKGDNGKGASGPPPIDLPPPPPPKKSVALIGAGAGLTAVAAGVGVALIVASGGKASDADTLLTNLQSKAGQWPCSSGTQAQDCATLHQLRLDSDTTHNAAVGLFVGAGVVGLATLTYALWPMKRPDPRQRQGLSVAPMFGGGTTGAALHGRF